MSKDDMLASAGDRTQQIVRTYSEALPAAMRRNDNWIVAAVGGSVAWPKEFEEVRFRDRTLYITPAFPDIHQSVCTTLVGKEAFADGQRLIWHFLSSLAWQSQSSIRVVSWSGGNLPRPTMQGRVGNVVTDHFDASDLPDPPDEKTRWALAFYREGLALEHTAYSFLSFYKIINIIRPAGKKGQKEWIKTALAAATDHQALQRIKELGPDPDTIADYLYHSNRCAIAHAGQGITVDPENIKDEQRLWKDKPLIKHLAEITIERELGI